MTGRAICSHRASAVPIPQVFSPYQEHISGTCSSWFTQSDRELPCIPCVPAWKRGLIPVMITGHFATSLAAQAKDSTSSSGKTQGSSWSQGDLELKRTAGYLGLLFTFLELNRAKEEEAWQLVGWQVLYPDLFLLQMIYMGGVCQVTHPYAGTAPITEPAWSPCTPISGLPQAARIWEVS